MSGDELTYHIAFAAIRGMGFDLAHKILDVIPSEKEFFEMPEQELKAITGGVAAKCMNAVTGKSSWKKQHAK
jgi:ribosomal protein S13